MTLNDLAWIFPLGLTSYALAQTIAWREGVGGIFEKLRDYLVNRKGMEIYSPADGERVTRPASHWARLFSCPYCLGVWTTLFFTLPLLLYYPPYIVLLLGGSGWGVQIFLQIITDLCQALQAKAESYTD